MRVKKYIEGAALLMYWKLCNYCISSNSTERLFPEDYVLFKVNSQLNFNLVIIIQAAIFYCVFLSKHLKSSSTTLHANNVNLINK